ncbi:MAG: fructose-bisphosphate aldolase class I [Acidobacteria bacterium]|nr:fructose-bisphosphate aldolase class I [Acidobacteriota bacterium]
MTAGSTLAATAQRMVAPGKGIFAADVPLKGLVRGWWGESVHARTEDAAADFQEMICRTPELGEHLSSIIVFPDVLDRRAGDGTPLVELIAERGLLLGITPTTGWQLLGGSEHEYVPRGLDGLAKRLEYWRGRGVAFVKWRVAARVRPGLPTERALVSNARSVAEVAALAHQFDLVPIVEPEVEMKGDHPIERQFEITERFLHRTFEALYEYGVAPEEIVLKTNMVVSGSDCPEQAGVDTVARETLRCLRRVVPPALPGIGFLSGGQSDLDATAHLDAMNRLAASGGPADGAGHLHAPWALSFSFGRAIGRAPVEAWDGRTDESSGQTALRHRARMNGLATLGEWSVEAEGGTED